MANYSITTNFGDKDNLASGNAAKVVRGSEFSTEFNSIQTAISTKADTTGDTFSGAMVFSDTLTANGNLTANNPVTLNSTATISGDLAVDTDTLFVDVSEDRVGINKANPTTALDVAGTGTFTNLNVSSVATFSALTANGSANINNSLYVNDSNNSNLYLQNSNVGTSTLNFAEGDGTAQPTVNGKIQYNHSNESLEIRNKNNLGLRIKDTGEIEFGESIGLNLATSGQTISGGHLYVNVDSFAKAVLKVNDAQSIPSAFKLFESNNNEMVVNNSGDIAFQTRQFGGFRFDVNALQPAGDTSTQYVSDMFNDNDNDTATLGVAGNRWNDIYLSNNPNVSSDQRLKENIADADDAGSTIDAIQVRKFDWITDGTHQSYGMIAQELAEVYPEAVSVPENDEDTLGIAYADLIPMLIKEVQSLRSRVAELENV
jgi:hypothetical protein